jgi:RNA polymerase sigma-70 factor, ECF subfamily
VHLDEVSDNADGMPDRRNSMPPNPATLRNLEKLDDAALVALARRGDASAFWLITKRNNRRLYRIARAVLGDDLDAEDVVQETYMRAFPKLHEFRAEASLSTWLTRIAINEALARRRRRRTTVDLDAIDTAARQGDRRVMLFPTLPVSDPEAEAARSEVRRLLERAIDQLPEPSRVVFVMRAIEQMSTQETASHLGLREETVKTRVHRARRLLRNALEGKLAGVLNDTFPFEGARCDRLSEAVLARLGVAHSLERSHR